MTTEQQIALQLARARADADGQRERAEAAERLCVAYADAFDDANHGDGSIDAITTLQCDHPDHEAQVEAMRKRLKGSE